MVGLKGRGVSITVKRRVDAALKWAEDAQFFTIDEIEKVKKAPYITGRPTKYQPVYALVVLHLGTMGYSHNEIARELKICHRTLHNWKHEHSEFLHALEDAFKLREAYFETCLRGSAFGTTKGNSNAIKFALTNVNPDIYKNTQVFEGRVDTTVEEVGMSADTAKKLDPKKRREILDVLNRVSESDTDG